MNSLTPPFRATVYTEWLFTAALKLHRCSKLSDDDRAALLSWATKDCGRQVPQREIDDAVRNSKRIILQGARQQRTSSRRTNDMRKAGRHQTGWPDLSADLREKVLADSPFSVAELRQRLPRYDRPTASGFGLVRRPAVPGDPLVCIGTSPAKCGTMRLSEIKRRYKVGAHALIVPSPMSALSGTNQEGKNSVRCLDNTGTRRFLVTEFDSGTLDEHASLILSPQGLRPTRHGAVVGVEIFARLVGCPRCCGGGTPALFQICGVARRRSRHLAPVPTRAAAGG